jgi:hypothetical protein
LEFATAIRTMPHERAQAMTRLWLTPERQHDWNRQSLEWDRKEQADWNRRMSEPDGPGSESEGE